MYTSPTTTGESEQRRAINGPLFAIAALVLMVAFAAGVVIGGEIGAIMLAALQTLPLAVLAVLAYIGVDRTWGKIATWVWMLVLVMIVTLAVLGMSSIGIIDTQQPEAFTPGLETFAQLAIVGGGILLSLVAGGLMLIPHVRRLLSRALPLNPESFVHTVALTFVVTVTLMSFVPLLVLGQPPLLLMIESLPEGADITGGRGDEGMLRDTLYNLVWLVPAAIVAVGYGIRRNMRESLARLGLVRPSWQQVLIGTGAAIGLVLFVSALGIGIERLWERMGWPMTDTEAFGELLAFAMSPIGAVVIGVTAGLGEELAVRGVLQPRLGILLSNLFFTSLHAFQYSWDSLLVVFLIGMVLGVIRARTNTTTAAITHGVYNFLLIMAAVLAVPFVGGQ